MRTDPRVTVELPPTTTDVASTPQPYRADFGPFDDEQAIREGMDRRYHGWSPGHPLTDWVAAAVVVRLVPDAPTPRHLEAELPVGRAGDT